MSYPNLITRKIDGRGGLLIEWIGHRRPPSKVLVNYKGRSLAEARKQLEDAIHLLQGVGQD